MKLFDLHTGEVVTLPPLIAPGRYSLLEAVTLNATVALNVGDVLWSDGGTRCDLQDQQGAHWQSAFEPISADQADAWQLVDQGVLTVAKLVESAAKEDLPAPLMPNNLTDFANPSAFERELKRVLDAGHLHEISARPRISMRYDSTVLPVSRARRLASGSLERLASRSEDWHRRTLGGVEPARVLAEVSEDEWGIYENIVFARLIDQAMRLIGRRERALALLIERQSSALKLSQAEDLNYRLREKLCRLWGKTWEAKPQDEDDPLHTRLKELRQLGQRLRQLRFGRLYQAIPRSGRVPIALKNTNILTHDQHYREMQELWQLAYQGELTQFTKPEEKIRQYIAQHRHYSEFLGLLIRHAINQGKTLQKSDQANLWKFSGAQLRLEQSHPCEWQLHLNWSSTEEKSAQHLTFVAAWAGESKWQECAEHCNTENERQLVYCHSTRTDSQLNESGEDGVLNPLQFYAVERIQQRIDGWLYQQASSRYPVVISSMPTHLCDDLLQREPSAFLKSSQGIKIVNRFKSSLEILDLARTHGANEATRSGLQTGLELSTTLATCRVCGTHVILDPSSAYGLCTQCGYEWTISRESRFGFRNPQNFRQVGAWMLKLCAPLAQPAPPIGRPIKRR